MAAPLCLGVEPQTNTRNLQQRRTKKMQQINWTREPENYCGEPVLTSTLFRADRIRHTSPTGRAFSSATKFWATLTLRIKRPAKTFLMRYWKPSSPDQPHPDFWDLEWYLYGGDLPTGTRTFNSLEAAKKQARTMAEQWAFHQDSEPQENTAPMFAGQLVPAGHNMDAARRPA